MRQNMNSSAIGTGSTSLITIFAVVCLIAFSSLSLLSAENDLKLAKNSAAATAAYYEAEAVAEQHVAEVAAALKNGASVPATKNGVFTFDTPINEIKTLRYTVAVNDNNVEVTTRCVIVEE